MSDSDDGDNAYTDYLESRRAALLKKKRPQKVYQSDSDGSDDDDFTFTTRRSDLKRRKDDEDDEEDESLLEEDVVESHDQHLKNKIDEMKEEYRRTLFSRGSSVVPCTSEMPETVLTKTMKMCEDLSYVTKECASAVTISSDVDVVEDFETTMTHQRPPKIDELLKIDPYLHDFQDEISRRYGVFCDYQRRIDECGGMEAFTSSYREFGLIVQPDNSVKALEWAPAADKLALIGDFNNWDQNAHVYKREEHGKWSLHIPANPDGSCRIPHNSVIKIAVTKNGQTHLKLSPWATYVTCPNPKETVIYHQNFWNPPEKYQLKEKRPAKPASLRIYEAHVGISSWEGKINTYRAFADEVLPRIKRQGYNAIQLMAVMEHVYYASFGYQVGRNRI
uniref:CBM_48 domain-containing protein n=1 Tax=Caenorhabditis japonica TaxID=281687 RepID=A0A8R1DP46_CAEJA